MFLRNVSLPKRLDSELPLDTVRSLQSCDQRVFCIVLFIPASESSNLRKEGRKEGSSISIQDSDTISAHCMREGLVIGKKEKFVLNAPINLFDELTFCSLCPYQMLCDFTSGPVEPTHGQRAVPVWEPELYAEIRVITHIDPRLLLPLISCSCATSTRPSDLP